MPTVTTRTVQLSVNNLTIEDIIRGVVGPVTGDGDSVTFSIPSYAQENDVMLFFISSHQLDGRVNYTSGDWDYRIYLSIYEEDAPLISTDPLPGIVMEVGFGKIAAAEVGTDITFNMVWESPIDGTVSTTLANPTLFGVIIKKENWNYTDYPTEFPAENDGAVSGWNQTAAPSGYANCDPSVLFAPIETVFYSCTNNTSPKPPFVQTLCSDANLYVGAKIHANAGVSVTYNTDTVAANINSMIGFKINYP